VSIIVEPLLVFEDNYSYLIIDQERNTALVVDPGDGEKIWAYLKRKEYELKAILATHHHLDHVAGIEFLCSKNEVPVFSSREELGNIPHANRGLKDGEELVLDDFVVQAILVPGHTHGHLAYRIDNCLFSGDTLFLGGCGRLFGGTAEQLFNSLYEKILVLPDDTCVYPGHEYTVRTRSFCVHIDPENTKAARALKEATALREKGVPTDPGLLKTEKETNVFLLCKDPALIAAVQLKAPQTPGDPLSVFTQLRSMMDVY